MSKKVAIYNLFQGQVKIGQVKVEVGKTIYGKIVTANDTIKTVIGGTHRAELSSIVEA